MVLFAKPYLSSRLLFQSHYENVNDYKISGTTILPGNDPDGFYLVMKSFVPEDY